MRKSDFTAPAGSDAGTFPSFFETPLGLKQLAQAQGVRPVHNIESLRADFWPDSDSIEEFASLVRAWRNEGT